MNGLRCRTCRAPIIFAVTDRGRRIPLDPVRVPDGNMEVSVADDGTLRAFVVKPGSAPTLYKTHFATCPNSAQHRRAPR